MSSVDFEYAIKTDVRNNPIVREVDAARQRQLWRSLAVGCVLVAVVLSSGWQKVELVQYGYRIHRVRMQHTDERDTNRRLRLDVETLRAPERIEKLAEGLNLVAPPRGHAIVIERVTPSAPPGKSVIAAR